MLRHIVAVETLMARSSSKAWQCSWRVRSGLALSCSGSHALSAVPLRAGGPGTPFLGSTSPVSFLSLSQRFMAGKDTEKASATSFLGTPRSTAASTRNLRSLEYGFISAVSSRIIDHAIRCESARLPTLARTATLTSRSISFLMARLPTPFAAYPPRTRAKHRGDCKRRQRRASYKEISPGFARRSLNGQGLREVMHHRGGARLRGDDAAHGEVVGSCLGFIKQFHKDSSQKLTS